MPKTYVIYSVLFFILVLVSCGENAADQTDTVQSPFPEVELASKSIQSNPKDPKAYYTRAEAFLLYEGYDQAIKDLNKAIVLDSMYIDAYHLLADTYLDYLNSRMALNTMYKAAGLFPNRIPTLLKTLEFQYILQLTDLALQTADRIITIDPQNADAYFWKGLIARDENKNIEAIQAFQKATALDPFLTDAWIECAKLMAKERKPLALRFFQNAIQLDSLNPHAWHALAEYYQEKDQYEEALKVYKELIHYVPDYAEGFYNAGLIYFEMDSLDKAKNHFDITIKVNPTFAKGYFARGNTHERMGNMVEARRDYEQALILEPNFEKANNALNKLGL